MKKILEIKNLYKNYYSNNHKNEIKVLNGINLEVDEGDFIAIMGDSGSGKTTLLNIIAGLIPTTSGNVLINKEDLTTLNDEQLADFRAQHLGYVFQDFNLLDNLDNRDNILLPLVLQNKPYSLLKEKLNDILKVMNIKMLLNKYPYELSGGQKQKIAIARALIVNPSLILADEPTGALDSKSSEQILELFQDINKLNHTILMVTHSIEAATYAKKVIFIKDGKLFHQLERNDKSFETMYNEITSTLSIMSNGVHHV